MYVFEFPAMTSAMLTANWY